MYTDDRCPTLVRPPPVWRSTKENDTDAAAAVEYAVTAVERVGERQDKVPTVESPTSSCPDAQTQSPALLKDMDGSGHVTQRYL